MSNRIAEILYFCYNYNIILDYEKQYEHKSTCSELYVNYFINSTIYINRVIYMHALNKNQDALKTDQEVRAIKSRIHVSSYLRLVSWIYLPPSLDIHILKYTDLLKSLTPITGKFNSLQMNQKRRLFLGKEQLTNTDIIKISKRNGEYIELRC